jgi:hypothetical protein
MPEKLFAVGDISPGDGLELRVLLGLLPNLFGAAGASKEQFPLFKAKTGHTFLRSKEQITPDQRW